MLLLSALMCLGTLQGLELPESPAARAWASVGPETTPVVLATELFEMDPWLLDPARARSEQTWSRWGEWLRVQGVSDEIDPQQRAGLALLAAGQARWLDAWAHFERLGAAPEWAAAVLPHLLAGVPLEHPAGRGGLPKPLPDGVLLQPAIPPQLATDAPGSLRPREASLRGLRVGNAVIDVSITVEPSGVQVDLLHVSGDAVTVLVLLPEPVGQEIRVEYIDWMRQDERRLPLSVRLEPGEEEHNLFGRFQSREHRLPGLPKARLPESLRRGGLWIEGPAPGEVAEPAIGELEAQARSLASALGKLFEIPAGYLEHGELPRSTPWTATVVHLRDVAGGPETLIELISLAERFVLAGGLH